MGMIVLVRGTLRGMGHEVECDLVAMRRHRPQRIEIPARAGPCLYGFRRH